MLPTCCRQLASAALAAALLGGCAAAGEAGGDRTFSAHDVPFTFRLPADFTDAPVDDLNSTGDVVAGAGLDKLDVIAVRRVRGGVVAAGRGAPAPHRVLGRTVASELHAVPGHAGWMLECQYTPERRDEVRAACRKAVGSVARR